MATRPLQHDLRPRCPHAFIDWDGARPGDRLWDLSWLAWTWCIQHLGNVPIDDQVRRVRGVATTYGDVDGPSLIESIIDRQTLVEEVTSKKLARLSPSERETSPQQLTVAGAVGDRDLLRTNRSLFITALAAE